MMMFDSGSFLGPPCIIRIELAWECKHAEST